MRSTVHSTLRAMPTQLVFGRDTLLNISFQADWQYIKERKQKLIEMRKREEEHRLAMLERKKRMDQEEQVSFGFIQLLRHFWVI